MRFSIIDGVFFFFLMLFCPGLSGLYLINNGYHSTPNQTYSYHLESSLGDMLFCSSSVPFTLLHVAYCSGHCS